MERRSLALLLAARALGVAHSLNLASFPRSDVPPAEQLRLGTTGKSMHVQGHTVSEVSARWGDNVVYAIFTSKFRKYHDNLLAQLETWADRPAREGRYVAVGGRDYPEGWQQNGTILNSNCLDSMPGISCKEATLLAEGAARGAAWLVITGEDNYVNTRRVDKILQKKNPDELVTWGCPGCGKGMRHYCRDTPSFWQLGGLCGGCGYILSRASLQLLLKDGAPALHNVYDKTMWPNDMTTSCILRKNNVHLMGLPGLSGGPIFSESELLEHVADDFLTLHYIKPAVMRWLHAVVEHKEPGVIGALEGRAFDRGCALGMNNSFWAEDVNACVRDWERKQELRKGTTTLLPP